MLISIINLILCAESINKDGEIASEFLQELRYAQVGSLYLTKCLYLQKSSYRAKHQSMFVCLLSKEQQDLGQKIDIFHTRNFVDTSLEDFTKHLYGCLTGLTKKIFNILVSKKKVHLKAEFEKYFYFRLKYGAIYNQRKGIDKIIDEEGAKIKRCIGAIKVMLCGLYTTYYRLFRYDRFLYMEGKRQDHCVFL